MHYLRNGIGTFYFFAFGGDGGPGGKGGVGGLGGTGGQGGRGSNGKNCTCEQGGSGDGGDGGPGGKGGTGGDGGIGGEGGEPGNGNSITIKVEPFFSGTIHALQEDVRGGKGGLGGLRGDFGSGGLPGESGQIGLGAPTPHTCTLSFVENGVLGGNLGSGDLGEYGSEGTSRQSVTGLAGSVDITYCQGEIPVDACNYPSFQHYSVCKGCCIWDDSQECDSPIILDIVGNGIALTNPASGVDFDLNADGNKDRFAWSTFNSDDAWLALDRNGNGFIDNGSELFGSYSPQPEPLFGEPKNGFLALAEFDKVTNGGNADGIISKKDLAFNNLRLWRDVNQNGISETTELFTLQQLGLKKIDLDYRDSRRTDEHGNRFRWKARVTDDEEANIGRWAWDVILQRQPN